MDQRVECLRSISYMNYHKSEDPWYGDIVEVLKCEFHREITSSVREFPKQLQPGFSISAQRLKVNKERKYWFPLETLLQILS